jgi:hypothetical protein
MNLIYYFMDFSKSQKLQLLILFFKDKKWLFFELSSKFLKNVL